MTKEIPDRLSVEKTSEFFDPNIPNQIEVYFNGIRQVGSVQEYCISEGWIRRIKKTATGRVMLDKDDNMIITLHKGEVKVEWKDAQGG